MKKIVIISAIIVVTIGVLFFVLVPSNNSQNQSDKTTQASQINQEIVSGNAYLLDVRTPQEFNSGHSSKAVNFDSMRIDQGEMPNIPKDAKVIETINGVVRDLDVFTNQLVDLHKLHEGKTGIINDPDELALCISIFNQYSGFSDRFRSVIFPVVITITEAYSESQELAKPSEASDISVITDVEIISETKKVQ